MARSRCTGRDIVVLALLLLSCTEKTEREHSRKTLSTATASAEPSRTANIERVEYDVHETAGCGCSGGGGGRGGVGSPSCQASRCVPRDSKRIECTLHVGPAAKSVGCGEVAIDPAGNRFAVRPDPKSTWRLWAGARTKYFVEWASWSEDEHWMKPEPIEHLDWTTAPAADAIFERAFREHVFHQDTFHDNEALHALAELHALVGKAYPERLARLAESDPRWEECSLAVWRREAWALSESERAALAKLLAPSFVDAKAPHRHRALDLAPPKVLLDAVGAPAPIVASADVELARAVMRAWGTTDAPAAAKEACKLLDKRGLDDAVADAALLAIGRAKTKCAAVLRHLSAKGIKCSTPKDGGADADDDDTTVEMRFDASDARRRLASADEHPFEPIDRCDPEIGRLLAGFAQGPTSCTTPRAVTDAARD